MTTVYVFLLFILFSLGATLENTTVSEKPITETTKSQESTTVPTTSKIENNTRTDDITSSTEKPLTDVNTSNTTELFDDGIPDSSWVYENRTDVDTRRILYSTQTKSGRRPYMVYLQLTPKSSLLNKYRGWTCGGVIVHSCFVLTSAACVEDSEHFFVVSGTNKFVDSKDYKSDTCVCRNRRKVVWKCVPKNYKYDFQDSAKWASNDIAIVKVEKPFKFGVCESGCQFATNFILYNNVSKDLEKIGTKGTIAGWGTDNSFREGVYRRCDPPPPKNAKCLQEAKVIIMNKELCCRRWSAQFRDIIRQYMICTRDILRRLSLECQRYANCTDIDDGASRRDEFIDGNRIDLGRHLLDPDDYTARRTTLGGFCENDHGGPLIVCYNKKEYVIGIISACKINPTTHVCYGPFLYTSVFTNRQFIQCAIHKDLQSNCRRMFRSGITHDEYIISWKEYQDEQDDSDDKDDDSDSHSALLSLGGGVQVESKSVNSTGIQDANGLFQLLNEEKVNRAVDKELKSVVGQPAKRVVGQPQNRDDESREDDQRKSNR